METIEYPIKKSDIGPKVSNLQEILLILLGLNIPPLKLFEKLKVIQKLKVEKDKNEYGNVTLYVVKLLQIHLGYAIANATGEIDKKTAELFNKFLENLDEEKPVQEETKYIVAGKLLVENKQPFPNILVCAFRITKIGVLKLGEDYTNIEGNYTIRYSISTTEEFSLRVACYQQDGTKLCESDIITNPKNLEIINLSAKRLSDYTFKIKGKVLSASCIYIEGLKIQIVDKAAGKNDQIMAETITDEKGKYQVTFTDLTMEKRKKISLDIQVRIFSNNKLIGVSDIRYNVTKQEEIIVKIKDEETKNLKSEYEALFVVVNKHFSGKLSELKENNEQRDLTYLSNKTGWDARAIALASLANQFADKTAFANKNAKIDPEFFYSLFRSGVAANEKTLYNLDISSVIKIWTQSIKQGIIPSSFEEKIKNASEAFLKLSSEKALKEPAYIGISSLKDLLTISLGNDDAKHLLFSEIHTQFRNNTKKFWEVIKERFGDEVESLIKIDSKLAYLTINNGPLMAKVYKKARKQLTDMVELVKYGYYDAETWKKSIGSDPVPKEIPGKDYEEKKIRYAEFMAAQVRLSYPTAVVGQMVINEQTTLKNKKNIDTVYNFLYEHQNEFEIGIQPIKQYVNKKKLDVPIEIVDEITRIQRVYQVTPSDAAMNALLESKYDSSYSIVKLKSEEFINIMKDKVGGVNDARLIYNKAQQVHNTILNVVFSYINSRTAPAIGMHSPPKYIKTDSRKTPENVSDILVYPALEKIFVNMDYCTCDHCRSIHGPAAYLVDLLNFCHNATNEKEDPQKVLFGRRPDLKYLQLTCENTNIVLPYIDLVNEILEFYVYHGSLINFKGNNSTTFMKSEELLANPAFIEEEAYKKLDDAMFPLVLPFNKSLEKLRRYFHKYDISLPEAMTLLRKTEDIERKNENDYGWKDILMEELSISRAEYSLLTNSEYNGGIIDIDQTLIKLYGYKDKSINLVLTELSNAKNYTQRVDITYEDLFSLLRTRFINPGSVLIPKLECLGVSFITLKKYKGNLITDDVFDTMVTQGLDESKYGGSIKSWVKDETNYNRIMNLITLVMPDSAIDSTEEKKVVGFEDVVFRYSDPDKHEEYIEKIDFIRMIHFIRIWKKLGWTIEQTDKVITALFPVDAVPNDDIKILNLTDLDAKMNIMIPRLGIIKQLINMLDLKLEKDLLSLLACFSSIDNQGTNSLYRKLFISNVLDSKNEAFIDNINGIYLSDKNKYLLDYSEILKASFNMTSNEFDYVVGKLGYSKETVLNIENISNIYRIAWLSRILKISVQEFLLLTDCTNINPFISIDPAIPPIISYLKLLNSIKNASLKVEEALYLIWNIDISGRSKPEFIEIVNFSKNLREKLVKIENEFNVTVDPEGELAQAKMTLVFGKEVTDVFFGILNKKVITEVDYSHSGETLSQAIIDKSNNGLIYDNFRKKLAFTLGVMSDNIKNDLLGIDGVSNDFKAAINKIYTNSREIFTRFPELQKPFEQFINSNNDRETKFKSLLTSLLPGLISKRKEQQVFQEVSSSIKAEELLVFLLLNDQEVVSSINDSTISTSKDFLEIEKRGLSADYYFSNELKEVADDSTHKTEVIDYDSAGLHHLPDNGDKPLLGIWRGYLEAPENGFFQICIESDNDAIISFMISGKKVEMKKEGTEWTNQEPVQLLSGSTYAIELQAKNLKNKLILKWKRSGYGWEIIPANNLYSQVLLTNIYETYVRFQKITSLAEKLKLNSDEITYFSAFPTYKIEGKSWLNKLAVFSLPKDADLPGLLLSLEAIVEYARIKKELSDERQLIKIIQDPKIEIIKDDCLLAKKAHWIPESLKVFLKHFGYVNEGEADLNVLKDLKTFSRIYKAFSLLEKLRISVSVLISSTTNEPLTESVNNLQAALRTRYSMEEWLAIIKPINDEMRTMQSNALVAYILHQMSLDENSKHIDSPEKLFEYFLVDVSMESCMQTSRIRFALSSVQLFIQRCILNLEANVSPKSIDQKLWEWMYRYRLWEANRKIFLYPENWLDPELRDDQSPFFKETMSELLQGDITDDRAANAFYNYLTKLEEVAKLEPCGMHYVEGITGSQNEVIHVIARTSGAKRKYFYRRCEGSSWFPWEQVKLDIEDNPVIPVVWKNRLFLFWLKIIQNSDLTTTITPPSEDLATITDASKLVNSSNKPKINIKVVLCWSEFINSQWQPTKTSDINKPELLTTVDVDSNITFTINRSRLLLKSIDENDNDNINSLRIICGLDDSSKLEFTLYNTYSLPYSYLKNDFLHKDTSNHFRQFILSGNSLNIRYGTDYNPNVEFRSTINLFSLKKGLLYQPIYPANKNINIWNAPFFSLDNNHLFLIKTNESIIEFKYHEGTYGPPALRDDFIGIVPMEGTILPDPVVSHSYDSLIGNPSFGIYSTGIVQNYLSEDNNINAAIASPGIVLFGDQWIGINGNVDESIMIKNK